MDFTYDLTIDPDAENNTHAFALGMIGHNKKVLEVGCATGYFTKVLAERGCKVIGMEIEPEAAKLAEQWAERVVVGNADDPEPWDVVDDESFDVVTFGDVLEHLRDPLIVLRRAVTKLKPAGFIVTSLPNIAHGDVRLSLLRGAFRYSDTGLLDRTHMRFFTLETVRELLAEAGLVVVDTQRVVVPLFHTEFSLSREEYPEAIVEEIRADADSETYQFVMKAVIDNGSQAVSDMAHALEESADRIYELESQIRRLQVNHDEYTALQEAHARLNEEIAAWTAHAAELNEQIRLLREELGAATARAEAIGPETDELRAALDDSEQRYRDLTNSRTFRLTAPLRRLAAAVRPRLPA
jgi:2-polyprenyl-3-methyl-5-hydroxy-6-metoxy-1,4-benzoquinol methylase